MRLIHFFLIFFTIILNSQTINVNNDFSNSYVRNSFLSGELETDYSFNIKPIDVNNINELI